MILSKECFNLVEWDDRPADKCRRGNRQRNSLPAPFLSIPRHSAPGNFFCPQLVQAGKWSEFVRNLVTLGLCTAPRRQLSPSLLSSLWPSPARSVPFFCSFSFCLCFFVSNFICWFNFSCVLQYLMNNPQIGLVHQFAPFDEALKLGEAKLDLIKEEVREVFFKSFECVISRFPGRLWCLAFRWRLTFLHLPLPSVHLFSSDSSFNHWTQNLQF